MDDPAEVETLIYPVYLADSVDFSISREISRSPCGAEDEKASAESRGQWLEVLEHSGPKEFALHEQ